MAESTAPYLFSDWLSQFPGIDFAFGGAVEAIHLPGVARLQRVNVLRIDLFQPGISFLTTLPGGDWSTRGATISEFMRCTPCVAAINANFSWYQGADQSGNNFVLFGLALTTLQPESEPIVVCDPTKPPKSGNSTDPDVCDGQYCGCLALLISSGNNAQITYVTAATQPPIDYKLWATAVAGSPQPVSGGCPPLFYEDADQGASPYVLFNGAPTWSQKPDSSKVAGRTVIGLSRVVEESGQDRPRYLYLLTIDGREGSTPQFGATYYDAGYWLGRAGADVGFGLDGGGSTAMALKKNGQITLVNTPFGDEVTPGFERAVGLFLGVIAPTAPTLTP